MNKQFKSSMYIKIVCVSLLPLALAFFLVFFVMYGQYSRQFESLVKNNLNEKALRYIEFANTHINKTKTGLEGAAAVLSSIERPPVPQIKALLSGMIASSDALDGCDVGFSDGLYVHPTWTPDADYDPRTRGWYKDTIAAGKFYVTPAYISAKDKVFIMSASMPMKDKNGQFVGVLCSRVYLDPLKDFLASQSDNINLFIINDNGNFISHGKYGFEDNLFEVEDGRYAGLKDLDLTGNFSDIVNIAGTKKFIVSQYDANLGWTIISEMDYGTAMKQFTTVWNIMTLLGVLFIIVVILISLFFLRHFTKPLRLTLVALENISEADGDLTVKIDAAGKDEFSQLAYLFNKTVEKIRNSIIAVKDSFEKNTTSLESISNEIVENVASLAEIEATMDSANKRIKVRDETLKQSEQEVSDILTRIVSLNTSISEQDEQVSAVAAVGQSISENMQTLTETLQDNMRYIKELSSHSQEASNFAKKSTQLLEEVNANSVVLTEAATVIQNISGQTNLLAMNAAIEAAHAGDAGRGFAVVSGEIRKLAEESAQQSKSISQVLKTLRDSITEVSSSSLDVAQVFGNVFDLSEKIAVSQRNMIDLVNTEVKNTNEQNFVLIRETTELSKKIKNDADQILKSRDEISAAMAALSEISEHNKAAMSEIAASTSQINTSFRKVSDSLQENNRNIANLNNEIGKFKV